MHNVPSIFVQQQMTERDDSLNLKRKSLRKKFSHRTVWHDKVENSSVPLC